MLWGKILKLVQESEDEVGRYKTLGDARQGRSSFI